MINSPMPVIPAPIAPNQPNKSKPRKDNPFGGKGQYARAYYEGGYTDKYYYGYELSRHQDYKIPSACLHTVGLEYGIMNRSDEQK